MWLLLGSIATHVERLTKSKLLLNFKPSLFQSCWPKCSERRVCCNNNSWARVVETASPKLHHHLVRLQDFKKTTCQKWWKQYTHTHHKPNNHFFRTHIICICLAFRNCTCEVFSSAVGCCASWVAFGIKIYHFRPWSSKPLHPQLLDGAPKASQFCDDKMRIKRLNVLVSIPRN